MKHGKGAYQFKEGSYTGDFINDNMEGKGILVFKDQVIYDLQEKYEGDFKGGLFEGKGIINFQKFKYEGEFQQNYAEG